MRELVATICIFLIGLTVFLAPVSADSSSWDIKILNKPHSLTDVSNATGTVQIINLTDPDEPINKSQLTDSSRVEYIYGGNRSNMTWLRKGLWYADFNINQTNGTGGSIEFEAQGETISSQLADSQGNETNATRNFNIGNISADIMMDFSEKVDPEKRFDIRVNATDTVNNQFEDQADVDVYISNVSWTSEIVNVDNFGDKDGDGTEDHYKNLDKTFNLDYSSTYVIHTNITAPVSYKDSFGSHSIMFRTLPELQGKIEYIDTGSGCTTYPSLQCERGAQIDAGINITSSQATNVNMTVLVKNKSSGQWTNISEHRLNDEGDLYTKSFTVPDINTSAYEKMFRLRFNITNEDLEVIKKKDIGYEDYRIKDISNSVTIPPSYTVKLEATRYFSPTVLEKDRIHGYVNVTDPDNQTFALFNLSDMSHDSETGVFSREIEIPFEVETGVYEKEIFVENIYGENTTKTNSFRVENVSKAFDIEPTDIEMDIQRQRVYTTGLNLTNLGAGNVTFMAKGEIENLTTVNNGSVLDVGTDERHEFNVSFNVTEIEDYEGEIKFMDNASSYNRTVDVELEMPVCDYRNGTDCATGDLEISASETGTIQKTLFLSYLGPIDSEKTYTPSMSGNISNLVEISPGVAQTNSENSTFTFKVNYTVSSSGYFTGNLSLGSLQIPVSLTSSAQAGGSGLSFSVKDSLDLGVWPESKEKTVQLEIENTGQIPINSFESSSPVYSNSISSESIQPGSSKNITLILSGLSESSTVDITAKNGGASSTKTVSVSVNPISNLAEEKSSLQSRLSGLDSQVDSPALQSQLDQASTKISQMETAYNQGNYSQAQSLYSEVTTTLDQIESSTSSSDTPDTNRTTPPSTSPPGNNTGNGGGGGMLPIIVGAAIVLLIGFIAATSIIPEEGDPFYNVLGK